MTDETEAWRAKAAVLRERGKKNTVHDISQAADYLDAAADMVEGKKAEQPMRAEQPLVMPVKRDERRPERQKEDNVVRPTLLKVPSPRDERHKAKRQPGRN